MFEERSLICVIKSNLDGDKRRTLNDVRHAWHTKRLSKNGEKPLSNYYTQTGFESLMKREKGNQKSTLEEHSRKSKHEATP